MIWNETMYVKKHIQTACCICVYHTAVGEILVCEKVSRNAVYTYCGCIGYRESCHAFAMNHLWVLNSEVVL